MLYIQRERNNIEWTINFLYPTFLHSYSCFWAEWKKMAAKSWSTTSESEHERLVERHREWKWKNHHHNSKAVRKRFSILLLLLPGWLFSLSEPSLFKCFSAADQKTKKNFLLLFSCTCQWRKYNAVFYLSAL